MADAMKLAALILTWLAMTACSESCVYEATQRVEDVNVRVCLKPLSYWSPHAEYKKFLEVEHAGQIQKKELFPDSGGYAWVALINNHGVLEVKTIDEIEYSLPINSLPKNTRLYLGRFDFDSGRNYKFIPALSDPHEPEPPK
jgi:hypothetical protein